jgi:hypothetical protein
MRLPIWKSEDLETEPAEVCGTDPACHVVASIVLFNGATATRTLLLSWQQRDGFFSLTQTRMRSLLATETEGMSRWALVNVPSRDVDPIAIGMATSLEATLVKLPSCSILCRSISHNQQLIDLPVNKSHISGET